MIGFLNKLISFVAWLIFFRSVIFDNEQFLSRIKFTSKNINE